VIAVKAAMSAVRIGNLLVALHRLCGKIRWLLQGPSPVEVLVRSSWHSVDATLTAFV
jgi:hypothetical protein